MSILGFSRSHSNSFNSMSCNSFIEFRKQAFFYIKEKIKTARLALTDVTPAQLLTEDATNENPWAPDPRTLALISRSAFEIDDYWRIVDILHHKLSKFDGKSWRSSYNTLIVLEHLLTHGPKSVADEFQTEMPIIKSMENFKHVDEKGFDWGLALKKKSERILKLLEKGPLLGEEREQARKLTRDIKGFGSFSQFSFHCNEDHLLKSNSLNEPQSVYVKDEIPDERSGIARRSPKENRAARDVRNRGDLHSWDCVHTEGSSLLKETDTEGLMEDDHPFDDTEKHTRMSLLAAKKED